MDNRQIEVKELSKSRVNLRDLDRHQVLGLFLTDALTPLLLLTAFVSSMARNEQEVFVCLMLAGGETLLAALIYSFVIGKYEIRIAHGAAILLHLGLTMYWLDGLREPVSIYIVMTLYLLALMFRFHGAVHSYSISVSNRTAFVLETIGIFLICIFFYVWAASVGGQMPGEMKPVFILLLFVSILFRIYWLWLSERLEFDLKGSPAWTVWGLLAAGLVIIAVLHSWIIHVVQLVAAGILSSMAPVLEHIPFPSLHLHVHPRKLSPFNPPPLGKQEQHHYLNIPGVIHWVTIILLILLVGLLLRFFLRRRTPQKPAEPASSSPETEIVRRSLIDIERHKYLQTDNPIRLKVQTWLRQQTKKGEHISNRYSFRRMVRHAKEPTAELKDLVKQYEAVRYGSSQSTLLRDDREIHSDE